MPDAYGATLASSAVELQCNVYWGKADVCAGDSGRAGGGMPLVWTRSAPASGSPRKPLVGFSNSCSAHAELRNVKVACTDGILSLGKTAAEHTLKTVLI